MHHYLKSPLYNISVDINYSPTAMVHKIQSGNKQTDRKRKPSNRNLLTEFRFDPQNKFKCLGNTIIFFVIPFRSRCSRGPTSGVLLDDSAARCWSLLPTFLLHLLTTDVAFVFQRFLAKISCIFRMYVSSLVFVTSFTCTIL